VKFRRFGFGFLEGKTRERDGGKIWGRKMRSGIRNGENGHEWEIGDVTGGFDNVGGFSGLPGPGRGLVGGRFLDLGGESSVANF
jgi:hypothetical protein